MFITMRECIAVNGNKPFNGVIHIGGHQGEEAQDYANNGVQRVVWVEANKSLMRHLFDKTRQHTMKQEYLNYCLSDVDDEKVTFNIANNGQSSSMLELGKHKELYPHIQYTKKIELVTKRFDTIAVNHKIDMKQYDFVNLDVQGAELKVLKGFGNLFTEYSNIKAIYSEINTEEIYIGCARLPELDSYLFKFGFKRVAHKMEQNDGWGDAIYVRN
jgi:FkbM family methyltransferase